MSKILTPTQSSLNQVKTKLIEDFKQYIAELDKEPEKYLETIRFTRSYALSIEVPKQKLFIKSEAYLQMLQYVLKSSKEIAWHCTITHDAANTFCIHDCMLYPQTVTGATVTTDQEKYQDWLNELEDDIFNNLKCQGHSHVNMKTNPSTVDLNFYEDLVAGLPENGYYVFLIMNKSQELHVLIYNKKENMLYTPEDIEVVVLDKNNEHLLTDIDLAIKENISENTSIYKRALTPNWYENQAKTYPTLQQPAPHEPPEPEAYYDDIAYFDRFYDDLDKNPTKKTKKRGK